MKYRGSYSFPMLEIGNAPFSTFQAANDSLRFTFFSISLPTAAHCYLYIIAALQAHPEIRRAAEKLGKAKGGIGSEVQGVRESLRFNLSTWKPDS